MNIVKQAAAAAVLATVALPVNAYACPTARITGGFGDACRDFTAHSSKDISHVQLHYADGRVVKDETITTPDYSINGGAGDEIHVAVVKSGRTTNSFTCDPGSPPVAALEIRMSPYCRTYTSSTGETIYWCMDGATNAQRTVFVDPGDLKIDMGCLPTEPLCYAITLRASSSTDPDGDIAHWAIGFGDGVVASGDWSATPAEEVTHVFASGSDCANVYCRITLTVTDSQGRSDTDGIDLGFYDLTPD